MALSRFHRTVSVLMSERSTSSSMANIRRCSWWSDRMTSVMSIGPPFGRGPAAGSADAGDAEEVHGLQAGRHGVAEGAPDGRGDRDRARLADPPHAHAKVLGPDHPPRPPRRPPPAGPGAPRCGRPPAPGPGPAGPARLPAEPAWTAR